MGKSLRIELMGMRGHNGSADDIDDQCRRRESLLQYGLSQLIGIFYGGLIKARQGKDWSMESEGDAQVGTGGILHGVRKARRRNLLGGHVQDVLNGLEGGFRGTE